MNVENGVRHTSNTFGTVLSSQYFHFYFIKVFLYVFIMKFVLISFIYFTSLHYVLSQYDIYSQILRPYNSYRYAQPTFRYPQLTAVSYLQSTANRYPQSTADRYPKFTAVRYLPSTADRYLKPTADRYLKPIAESYSQSTVDSSPQPTVFRYSSYKSFTPKGRSLVITKKVKQY